MRRARGGKVIWVRYVCQLAVWKKREWESAVDTGVVILHVNQTKLYAKSQIWITLTDILIVIWVIKLPKGWALLKSVPKNRRFPYVWRMALVGKSPPVAPQCFIYNGVLWHIVPSFKKLPLLWFGYCPNYTHVTHMQNMTLRHLVCCTISMNPVWACLL